MSLNFNVFKKAVQQRFADMQSAGQLFRIKLEKGENGEKLDILWSVYLGAFPEGTNPLYRERTEHDCTCCKRFIRDVGDVVAVVGGKLVSIWDIDIGKKEPAYQVVADALSAAVKTRAIGDTFLHYEAHAGTDRNFEQLVGGGQQGWDHFFVNIPRQYVVKKADLATKLSEFRSMRDALHRSLTDLRMEDIDAALELIAQGSVYRGDQFKGATEAFRKLKVQFDALDAADQEQFAWLKAKETGPAISSFRGSLFGQFIENMATKDIEDALRMYESQAAPTNYKRPTAVATKGMIEKAKAELQKLGLVTALERRFAVLSDISINNVLFANRDAKAVLTGDVFDDLMGDTKVNAKSFDKLTEVPIEKFLADILPTAKGIELFVENRHMGNLVSLIAPTDPTAGKLFAWDNAFSWSYAGDVTDSIKERVKKAGGQVVGELCCRLAWDYTDDLDFHMKEPGGTEIYYGSYRLKGGRGLSPCGGELDLDANGVDGQKAEPCENIYYASRRQMKEGVYELFIHNFNRRSNGSGFGVDIEFDGVTTTIYYDKVIPNGARMVVAKIKYSHKDGFEIIESMPSTTSSKEEWGVTTQTFKQVNVVMLSPNYWDDQQGVGNKHYFFMLQGAANTEQARGFYNEFLTPELNKHRKVLEMVGSKLKTAKAAEQLSGLGFSSTQRNSAVVRVKGATTRIIRVTF